MKKVSLGITIFFIVVSIAAFSIAWTYPGASNGAMGPGFFPMIMAGIIFFICILLLINILKQKDSGGAFFTKTNVTIFLSVVIIAVYIVSIGILGFLLSTFLYLFGFMKFLKSKKWILPLLVAGCTTGVLYGVFTKFLLVQLPRGILF